MNKTKNNEMFENVLESVDANRKIEFTLKPELSKNLRFSSWKFVNYSYLLKFRRQI